MNICMLGSRVFACAFFVDDCSSVWSSSFGVDHEKDASAHPHLKEYRHFAVSVKLPAYFAQKKLALQRGRSASLALRLQTKRGLAPHIQPIPACATRSPRSCLRLNGFCRAWRPLCPRSFVPLHRRPLPPACRPSLSRIWTLFFHRFCHHGTRRYSSR